MKTNRTALVLFSLTLGLLWRAPAALAASDVMSPELEQSLRQEVDAVGDIIQEIDALLRTTEKGKITPQAAAAHREATTEYAEAKKLIEARKYEDGYKKLKTAKASAMQAASELVAKGVAAPIDKMVGRLIDAAALRVKAVADLLKGKSNPEATAAYQEGEKLYQSAKSQYTAGQHRDAYKTLDQSLAKLDDAIRILWNAKGPASASATEPGTAPADKAAPARTHGPRPRGRR